MEGTKFRAFFSISRPHFVLFSLSGVFSWNLVVCLKAGTLKCARLEFSGCRVKPRRRAQTCAFQGPGVSRTPLKFHEKTPKRGKKERKMEAGERKKRPTFWAVRGGLSGGGGSSVRWLGAGWSRESKPTTTPTRQQPQQHQHRQKWRVEAKPRISVAPNGRSLKFSFRPETKLLIFYFTTIPVWL